MITPNINKKYKNYCAKLQNNQKQKNAPKKIRTPHLTNINIHQNLSKNYQKPPKKNLTQYHRIYKPPAKPTTSKNINKEPKSKPQTQNQNMTTQTPKSRNTKYNITIKNTHKKTPYYHNKPNTTTNSEKKKTNLGLGLPAKSINNSKKIETKNT